MAMTKIIASWGRCIAWPAARPLAVAVALSGTFLSVHAQVTAKTYFEQGVLARSGEVVDVAGPNLMGDQVNEYSGDLSFTQVDASLPGNSELPVSVARYRSASADQAFEAGGLFGDWDIDIPR